MEPNLGDSLSRVTVAVVCPDCGGEGMVPDPSGVQREIQCNECKGGRHVSVNRDPSGGVPAGYRGWVDYEMPAFVPNPLRLTH